MGPTRTLTAAVAFFLLGTAPASRYPIPPQPLTQLLAEAAVAARVSVLDVRFDPRTDGYQVTTLSVQRMLLGAAAESLVVMTHPNIICPMDATFREGEEGIVFLAPKAERELHQVQGLSWGFKRGSTEAIDAWQRAIEGRLALTKEPDAAKRRALELEWIVATAECATTCWDGAVLLCPEGDEWTSFDDEAADPVGPKPAFAELSVEQRTRLRTVLLASTTLDAGSRALEGCFATTPDSAIDRWLLARMRGAAAGSWEGGATILGALRRLERRRPDLALASPAAVIREKLDLDPKKRDAEMLEAVAAAIAAVSAFFDHGG